MHIGYIGMGIMGLPMAINLTQAGHDVTVWNRTASKCKHAVDAGAKQAASVAELAAACDVIFLNLTDTPDVEAVVFDEANQYDGGIAAHAAAGSIIVDNSTINSNATQAFAQRLEPNGVAWVDAPVSGGDTGAIAGTLSIMCGGSDEAFARVQPLLDVLGGSVIHLGGVGTGQACKACNQIAGMTALLGVCEAVALAKAAGLDPRRMVAVVSRGAAGSWQIENLGPKIIDADFDPGFMVKLALKDLGIVLESAKASGLDLKTTKLAHDAFTKITEQGGGELGTQAIAKVVGT